MHKQPAHAHALRFNGRPTLHYKLRGALAGVYLPSLHHIIFKMHHLPLSSNFTLWLKIRMKMNMNIYRSNFFAVLFGLARALPCLHHCADEILKLCPIDAIMTGSQSKIL